MVHGVGLFQGHHLDPLGGPGGLDRDAVGLQQQGPALGGVEDHLFLLPFRQEEDVLQGALVGVSPGELLPAGYRLVAGQGDPGRLAVFEEEEEVAGVVPCQASPEDGLPLLHLQLGGEVVPQDAGLGVVEVPDEGLVALLPVGEEEELRPGVGLPVEGGAVPLLVLLLPGHPQGLGGDLFKISLPGEEEVDRRHRQVVLRRGGLHQLVHGEDLGVPGGAVLLLHPFQLADDLLADPGGFGDEVGEVGDVLLQLLGLGGAFEDVLLVDVPQADVRHVLGLDPVQAKARHEVGHHHGVLLGLPDDGDGLVDVQEDDPQALEEVELLLLLLEGELGPPADAVGPPGGPPVQDLPHPHDLGHPVHQDVEVAGEGVLEGGGPEELLHELVRVGAPFQVDGQLQAGQVGLVPHVGHFPELAGLDELGHLVQDGLHRGGVGDLVDLDEVVRLHIPPLGPDLEGAPAGGVDGGQLLPVVEELAPGGKVRGQDGVQQVALRVADPGDGPVAHLRQVKPAEVGGHAHGDAHVGRDQNVGEGGGQEEGLSESPVVVGDKVHHVFVDVPEELFADAVQLDLGVPGGGVGHVPGVDLAEVALGVHRRVEEGAVPLGQADHGLIDGRVPVGVELHGGPHHVGRLGPPPGEQLHLVHGVQELAVGGLEPVDLRDGPGDDDAHGVGHVVEFQGVGNGLLHHFSVEAHHPFRGGAPFPLVRRFFSCHSKFVPFQMHQYASSFKLTREYFFLIHPKENHFRPA